MLNLRKRVKLDSFSHHCFLFLHRSVSIFSNKVQAYKNGDIDYTQCYRSLFISLLIEKHDDAHFYIYRNFYRVYIIIFNENFL